MLPSAVVQPLRLLLFVCCAVLMLATGCLAIGSEQFEPNQQQPDGNRTELQSGDVNALVAGLSDEQVRRLLLDELKKTSAEDGISLTSEVPGPGALLGKLLRQLSQKSDSQEDELRAFLGGIPNVLPDLYKVFITL